MQPQTEQGGCIYMLRAVLIPTQVAIPRGVWIRNTTPSNMVPIYVHMFA